MLILRHAWLNLWDKHMTTGRINQVTTVTSESTVHTSENSHTWDKLAKTQYNWWPSTSGHLQCKRLIRFHVMFETTTYVHRCIHTCMSPTFSLPSLKCFYTHYTVWQESQRSDPASEWNRHVPETTVSITLASTITDVNQYTHSATNWHSVVKPTVKDSTRR